MNYEGLDSTKEWFDVAIPKPTTETACIQIGCHFEEVAEMMEALNLNNLASIIHELSNMFKTRSGYAIYLTNNVDRDSLADAMGDQVVTSVGVMRNLEMNAIGIINEINRSNFSKFEDGKPVFDKNGKITKGKHYTAPDIKPFV